MSDAQVLAKLHDIQLPEPIGWWPLAPGWYGVLFLSLFIIGLLLFCIRRSLVNAKAKRQALQLLANYEQEYQIEQNSQLSAMKVSELLRRVALVYFSREEVASLGGKDWLTFLSNTSKGLDFMALQDYLLVLPYQQESKQDTNLKPLFQGARAWIKQRGVPCSN